MYSYLTSMTSAVITGIKHRKNLPLSLMEEEMSLNTCMGKINSEKVLILQSFLGAELCFNTFSPITQCLKQRIRGISKDNFITWGGITDTNKIDLPTYKIFSAFCINGERSRMQLFLAHELCMYTVTGFPILILSASGRQLKITILIAVSLLFLLLHLEIWKCDTTFLQWGS